jgi:hypothetical protein
VSRALFFVAALLGGCAPTTLEDTPCPPTGTELTYESFGEPFFTAHCTRCHGGSHGYSSRAFASVERIREDKERIFLVAAADNVSMPPGPDDPPAEDRQRLAEWLACGAP